MLAVQPGRGSQGDEELAAVCVGTRIRHAEHSGPGVLQLRGELVLERGAVDGGAAAARPRWVAGLDHEVGDHAVEGCRVVVAACGEGGKVLARLHCGQRHGGRETLCGEESSPVGHGLRRAPRQSCPATSISTRTSGEHAEALANDVSSATLVGMLSRPRSCVRAVSNVHPGRIFYAGVDLCRMEDETDLDSRQCRVGRTELREYRIWIARETSQVSVKRLDPCESEQLSDCR